MKKLMMFLIPTVIFIIATIVIIAAVLIKPLSKSADDDSKNIDYTSKYCPSYRNIDGLLISLVDEKEYHDWMKAFTKGTRPKDELNNY